MELFWIFVPISRGKKGALKQLTEWPEKHLCLFLLLLQPLGLSGFVRGFPLFVWLLLLLLFR